MKDYDELWNQYAAEFNEKLESDHGGDWRMLDALEQEIAALWKLTADMYSAGFDEFFLNWGHECYSYAMRGIQRIADADQGASACREVYELFDQAYTRVFARFEDDERIQAYEDIVQYLTGEDEEILEETYDRFDETLGPLLCRSAYEFYCEKNQLSVSLKG